MESSRPTPPAPAAAAAVVVVVVVRGAGERSAFGPEEGWEGRAPLLQGRRVPAAPPPPPGPAAPRSGAVQSSSAPAHLPHPLRAAPRPARPGQPSEPPQPRAGGAGRGRVLPAASFPGEGHAWFAH